MLDHYPPSTENLFRLIGPFSRRRRIWLLPLVYLALAGFVVGVGSVMAFVL